MTTGQLKEYIETLSKAHAAGHKCDQELRTAIEMYTSETGIKSEYDFNQEHINKEARKQALNMVNEFSFAYYDIVTGHSKLIEPRVLSMEFRNWVAKRTASNRPNTLNEVEAV